MLQKREVLLSGTMIIEDDFVVQEGYLCIRDGIIVEIGKGRVEADLEGIVCPCFLNAHIHLGDSAFKDPPFMPLPDLVGPGGLKHRLLAQAPQSLLLEGMRRSLREMAATGTCAFADFREGGPAGVRLLTEALKDVPLIARVLGRPDEGETKILESCWGLGVSSTRDYDRYLLDEAVKLARERGQKVGIHAGEWVAGGREAGVCRAEDIRDALALEPDFLVHLSRASGEDLKRVADAGVPVVICPRSNLVTGAGLPDARRMVELGITVGVGTDNVMLNSPNMFDEMQLLGKALLHDDRQVFKMCTLNGAKIMGIDQRVGCIREGMEGRVMVLNANSNNLWGSLSPLASVVRRSRPSDVLAVF
jgi:cytosine/adenosine deaminase-related metal-dependent hydrolase